VFATATRRLIGAQVAGLDAAPIIAPLALAIAAASTAETLGAMAFPHPMLTAGINKAARSLRANGWGLMVGRGIGELFVKNS